LLTSLKLGVDPHVKSEVAFYLVIASTPRVESGGDMDFITNLFTGIDWILIAQLLMLTLVVVAGPAVIFVLFLRGGDL